MESKEKKPWVDIRWTPMGIGMCNPIGVPVITINGKATTEQQSIMIYCAITQYHQNLFEKGHTGCGAYVKEINEVLQLILNPATELTKNIKPGLLE